MIEKHREGIVVFPLAKNFRVRIGINNVEYIRTLFHLVYFIGIHFAACKQTVYKDCCLRLYDAVYRRLRGYCCSSSSESQHSLGEIA